MKFIRSWLHAGVDRLRQTTFCVPRLLKISKAVSEASHVEINNLLGRGLVATRHVELSGKKSGEAGELRSEVSRFVGKAFNGLHQTTGLFITLQIARCQKPQAQHTDPFRY